MINCRGIDFTLNVENTGSVDCSVNADRFRFISWDGVLQTSELEKIVLTSIDKDGLMEGMIRLEIIFRLNIPIIFLTMTL